MPLLSIASYRAIASTMMTPTQRTTAWRKERIAAGYRQKNFLLSPRAIRSLKAMKIRFDLASEADVVELALKELAGKGNK